MEIYLARKQVQAGPYSIADFNIMVEGKQIEPTDLMWHQGMSEWQTVEAVIAHNFPYKPLGGDNSSASGPNINSQANAIETATMPNEAQTIAALNDRILAKIVDLSLLTLPLPFIIVNLLPAGGIDKITALQAKGQAYIQQHPFEMIEVMGTTSLIAALVYALCFIALQAYLLSKHGHSIGKKLFGLAVVPLTTLPTVDGGLAVASGPNFKQCFLLRSLPFILLTLSPFYLFSLLELLWAGFDPAYRQTLHDRLAKTIVVKRKTG